MSPRAFLQRYGVDLALSYLLAAAVLYDRTGLTPIGPWFPSGWYGAASIESTVHHVPLWRLIAAWLALLLPYFGPPLLLWLLTLVPSSEGQELDRSWSFPRMLLLCAAWIATVARFEAFLGLLWLEMDWPFSFLSPTLLGWALPFGPPLAALAVWAWRHRRATTAVAAA